jgi:hypothetical protein
VRGTLRGVLFKQFDVWFNKSSLIYPQWQFGFGECGFVAHTTDNGVLAALRWASSFPAPS